MKLIKAAIVYKATIPTDTAALHAHLAEKPFTECLQMQLRSVGFVPVTEDTQRLVSEFPGGLAFRVRIDEKVIPASAVKTEVEKRIKATGAKAGKKMRSIIKEEVMRDLCARALVKTTASVTCFYDIASGYLIIPTTSQKIADVCVTMLIEAVGSVKTETVHVSEVKHGLTTRLTNWLAGTDDAFGKFAPCDEVALATEGRKITVKMSILDQAREGLNEALGRSFQVTSIGFWADGMAFRLTSDFHFKSISFVEHEIADGEDNPWAAEAALQVKKVSGVIADLVELLSYKEGGAL